jgi:hypothetical protein
VYGDAVIPVGAIGLVPWVHSPEDIESSVQQLAVGVT